MDPSKIPFNALIVGPTNSGKSMFVVDQIYGFLALANAALITTKHIDFNSHLDRKDLLEKAKLEEIPQHTSPTAEHLQTNSE